VQGVMGIRDDIDWNIAAKAHAIEVMSDPLTKKHFELVNGQPVEKDNTEAIMNSLRIQAIDNPAKQATLQQDIDNAIKQDLSEKAAINSRLSMLMEAPSANTVVNPALGFDKVVADINKEAINKNLPQSEVDAAIARARSAFTSQLTMGEGVKADLIKMQDTLEKERQLALRQNTAISDLEKKYDGATFKDLYKEATTDWGSLTKGIANISEDDWKTWAGSREEVAKVAREMLNTEFTLPDGTKRKPSPNEISVALGLSPEEGFISSGNFANLAEFKAAIPEIMVANPVKNYVALRDDLKTQEKTKIMNAFKAEQGINSRFAEKLFRATERATAESGLLTKGSTVDSAWANTVGTAVKAPPIAPAGTATAPATVDDGSTVNGNNYLNLKNANGTGFRQFNTRADATDAYVKQIQRYGTKSPTGKNAKTLKDIIGTWRPASDQRGATDITQNEYENMVSKASGIDLNAPFDFTKENIAKIIPAMAKVEQGINISLEDVYKDLGIPISTKPTVKEAAAAIIPKSDKVAKPGMSPPPVPKEVEIEVTKEDLDKAAKALKLVPISNRASNYATEGVKINERIRAEATKYATERAKQVQLETPTEEDMRAAARVLNKTYMANPGRKNSKQIADNAAIEKEAKKIRLQKATVRSLTNQPAEPTKKEIDMIDIEEIEERSKAAIEDEDDLANKLDEAAFKKAQAAKQSVKPQLKMDEGTGSILGMPDEKVASMTAPKLRASETLTQPKQEAKPTAPKPKAKPTPTKASEPSNTGDYTIAKGDTLSAIAKRNNISVAELKVLTILLMWIRFKQVLSLSLEMILNQQNHL
jgi:LysM repeat protein